MPNPSVETANSDSPSDVGLNELLMEYKEELSELEKETVARIEDVLRRDEKRKQESLLKELRQNNG